jgi:hypothetical protein
MVREFRFSQIRSHILIGVSVVWKLWKSVAVRGPQACSPAFEVCLLHAQDTSPTDDL